MYNRYPEHPITYSFVVRLQEAVVRLLGPQYTIDLHLCQILYILEMYQSLESTYTLIHPSSNCWLKYYVISIHGNHM